MWLQGPLRDREEGGGVAVCQHHRLRITYLQTCLEDSAWCWFTPVDGASWSQRVPAGFWTILPNMGGLWDVHAFSLCRDSCNFDPDPDPHGGTSCSLQRSPHSPDHCPPCCTVASGARQLGQPGDRLRTPEPWPQQECGCRSLESLQGLVVHLGKRKGLLWSPGRPVSVGQCSGTRRRPCPSELPTVIPAALPPINPCTSCPSWSLSRQWPVLGLQSGCGVMKAVSRDPPSVGRAIARPHCVGSFLMEMQERCSLRVG